MTDREILNITDTQILKYMEVLQLTTVTAENLKVNFRRLMMEHHTDKGGDNMVSQDITRAKRVLEQCLESGRTMPRRVIGPSFGGRPMEEAFPHASFTSSNFNYQEYADYAYANHDGEWRDPANAFRRKGKGKNNKFAKQTKYSAAFGDGFDAPDPFDTPEGRGRSRPKTYNNGYQYEEDDEFVPYDPQKYNEEAQPREIRGGLLLRNPLSGYALPDYFQQMMDSINFEEIDYSSIKFDPSLSGLVMMLESFDTYPSLETLIKRTKTFIYLDWLSSLQSERTPYVGLKLNRKNTFTFTLTLPKLEEDDLVDDRLKDSVRVRLYSTENKCLNASAIIESIDFESNIVSFVFDESEYTRGVELYESNHYVDIVVSPSVFLYKAYLRGIDGIEEKEMDDFIYPEPKFLTPPETENISDCTVVSDKVKDKKTTIVFNRDQEAAINTVVNGKCEGYPFVLFGPPGTGKTATLVESIRRILEKGKEKRVLVCAPSNMAADVIAETIVKRGFLQKRYIFRMNSLSGDANLCSKTLENVVCRLKEKEWWYGIPCLANLQVFRVIVCTLSASVYLNIAGGMRGYFSHILIDECGQATEQETWIPIGCLAVPGQTTVALYGDPKQLGPIEQVGFTKIFGYGKSMIERLMNTPAYKGGDKRLMVMLKQNYRSHACILKAASKMFYNEELITTRDDPELYRMCGWKELPNEKFPIIFHSIAGSREVGSKSGSKRNNYEINKALDYVKKLSEHNVKTKDIGIISPYKLQGTDLKKELERRGWSDITVNSVEGFQGSERKIIIFLTTRTDNLGFIACDKRLNTSITRAQQLLIILGNEQLLDYHISWAEFIHYCKSHQAFINSELIAEPAMDLQPQLKYNDNFGANVPPPGFGNRQNESEFEYQPNNDENVSFSNERWVYENEPDMTRYNNDIPPPGFNDYRGENIYESGDPQNTLANDEYQDVAYRNCRSTHEMSEGLQQNYDRNGYENGFDNDFPPPGYSNYRNNYDEFEDDRNDYNSYEANDEEYRDIRRDEPYRNSQQNYGTENYDNEPRGYNDYRGGSNDEFRNRRDDSGYYQNRDYERGYLQNDYGNRQQNYETGKYGNDSSPPGYDNIRDRSNREFRNRQNNYDGYQNRYDDEYRWRQNGIRDEQSRYENPQQNYKFDDYRNDHSPPGYNNYRDENNGDNWYRRSDNKGSTMNKNERQRYESREYDDIPNGYNNYRSGNNYDEFAGRQYDNYESENDHREERRRNLGNSHTSYEAANNIPLHNPNLCQDVDNDELEGQHGAYNNCQNSNDDQSYRRCTNESKSSVSEDLQQNYENDINITVPDGIRELADLIKRRLQEF